MRVASLLLAGASITLAACDKLPASLGGYTYRAEVGYREGQEEKWFVGSDRTREECTSEATAYFNRLNSQSPGRAFSWACRKMKGENFLDRVR
jgi:hypothetical protein